MEAYSDIKAPKPVRIASSLLDRRMEIGRTPGASPAPSPSLSLFAPNLQAGVFDVETQRAMSAFSEAASESDHGMSNESAGSDLPPATKIVCTIGPNSNNPETLGKLLLAGMNVVRMNFSHGDHAYHSSVIRNVRQVAEETRRLVGLMLDTKGPEIRTGKLKGGNNVQLKKGQVFTLTTDDGFVGDSSRVAVLYKNMTKALKVGDSVLIDDGLIQMTVAELTETEIVCRVENDGELGETKGVNLPGVAVDLPAVTEKDKADLRFGVKQGVDFIAASFVRKADDVLKVREVLGEEGKNIKIIAKIENREGLENFDEILNVTDGVMVARGDLGVEIPIEQVCLAQKMMIGKCNVAGKFVITATQMLESMVYNPSPTRAEAGDVTNAVMDGTDCVMLSGETAKGKYPVESVAVMADICKEAEAAVSHKQAFRSIMNANKGRELGLVESIASAAVKASLDLPASCLIALSETGNTARLIAKYRPAVPILTVTPSDQTARQCMVNRGLFPLLVGSMIGSQALVTRVIEAGKVLGVCKQGDKVVMTSGYREGQPGLTNTMKILRVGDESQYAHN